MRCVLWAIMAVGFIALMYTAGAGITAYYAKATAALYHQAILFFIICSVMVLAACVLDTFYPD